MKNTVPARHRLSNQTVSDVHGGQSHTHPVHCCSCLLSKSRHEFSRKQLSMAAGDLLSYIKNGEQGYKLFAELVHQSLYNSGKVPNLPAMRGSFMRFETNKKDVISAAVLVGGPQQKGRNTFSNEGYIYDIMNVCE